MRVIFATMDDESMIRMPSQPDIRERKWNDIEITK